MKIHVITQNVPLYIHISLNKFLEAINNTSYEISGITVLSTDGGKSFTKILKERYNLYGLVDFLKGIYYIMINKLLSYTFYIFPVKKCFSLKNVSDKYSLKEVKVKSINSDEFIKYIKDNKIDLIISIAAPEIFKKDILNAPLKGCLNYHSSLLPKYRGRQPLFWAMLNGEKEVGVTIHEMDELLDNGPIVVQKKVPIDENDSLHSLYLKTIEVGYKALIEAIEIVDKNSKERILNDSTKATFYSFPTKEHGRLFRKKGKRFF